VVVSVLVCGAAHPRVYEIRIEDRCQRRREESQTRTGRGGFNNITDQRRERVRTFRDMAEDFYDAYKLRLPDSATFAEYAIYHLNRLLGAKMLVDFNEAVVVKYQNDRLEEKAAPKTINEEVGFLLRILGEPGDLIRLRLRKKKMLKLKTREVIGKAYSEDEKRRMLEEAAKARSPHIYLALTLALNAGMRDGEIKRLTWAQICTRCRLSHGWRGSSRPDAGRRPEAALRRAGRLVVRPPRTLDETLLAGNRGTGFVRRPICFVTRSF
jgi:integrase